MNAKILALLIGVVFVGLFTVSTPAHPLCLLDPPFGFCQSSISRFAPVVGKCREYIYGGCSGKANNFQAQAKCQANCG
uniref:Kunitz-type serine protease inhibitor bicolin n=1 Tax=Vespa bicolor TaxID=619325 RepID=VKT_VESBI|nr:RecName: Full=Kunitz-type serine protease inhibitor bicolin; Flags: Precursor [Vespa bicolor]ACN58230.1 serine protease inhibitor [Vespa bicolor]